MKQIDFVERLNFLLETLYYDALASKNRLVFEYSPEYPRVFGIDDHNILKAMEWITKAFLAGVSQTNMNINFKLTNYNANTLFFSVFFTSYDEVSHFDDDMMRKAKEFANNAGAKILIYDKKSIVLNVKAILDRNINTVNFTLKSPSIKSWRVIVGHEDTICFGILTSTLKAIGVKIGAKSDFETFRRHIKDSIYTPSVVFISMEYFKNDQDLNDLLEFQKTKGYGIVVVCHKESELDIRLQNNAIIIREPYTYDSIIAALNTCYTRLAKSKFTH